MNSHPLTSEGSASAEQTAGLLPPLPLRVFAVTGVTAIIDANGNEVVGWLGFDDSNRTRAEHNALARRIVQCFNAHDTLMAELRRAETYLRAAAEDASLSDAISRRLLLERANGAREAIEKVGGAA